MTDLTSMRQQELARRIIPFQNTPEPVVSMSSMAFHIDGFQAWIGSPAAGVTSFKHYFIGHPYEAELSAGFVEMWAGESFTGTSSFNQGQVTLAVVQLKTRRPGSDIYRDILPEKRFTAIEDTTALFGRPVGSVVYGRPLFLRVGVYVPPGAGSPTNAVYQAISSLSGTLHFENPRPQHE